MKERTVKSLNRVKEFFKNIFHTHKWTLSRKFYFTNHNNEAYDVWYTFECQKCKRKKTIKTTGVDVFQTKFERMCKDREEK